MQMLSVGNWAMGELCLHLSGLHLDKEMEEFGWTMCTAQGVKIVYRTVHTEVWVLMTVVITRMLE